MGGKGMTWDEFRYQKRPMESWGREETDIKCPKCGDNIFMRTDIVLTSYPAQYSYFCKCGWTGTAFTKWSPYTTLSEKERW